MNAFEFVIAIVAVSCLAGIIKQYIRTKNHVDPSIREIQDKLSRIEELEQRIQTLETIVTDKGYDLKREFDHL